jgi:membrane protein YqaA with SNARE-associated domain
MGYLPLSRSGSAATRPQAARSVTQRSTGSPWPVVAAQCRTGPDGLRPRRGWNRTGSGGSRAGFPPRGCGGTRNFSPSAKVSAAFVASSRRLRGGGAPVPPEPGKFARLPGIVLGCFPGGHDPSRLLGGLVRRASRQRLRRPGLWAWATAGHTLGAAVNWLTGRYLLHFQDRKCFFFSWPGTLSPAQRWFQRYGVWSLLLAWAPVEGDALTFIAGFMRVRFDLAPIAIGKGTRYAILLGMAEGLGAMWMPN